MKTRWNHIAGLALMLMTVSLHAQLISVQSGFSSDSMMIGDQVLFNIHVEASENVAFQMPRPGDTLSRDLEILFPVSADTSQVDGDLVINHSYLVTCFEGGAQLVPSQPVIYKFGNTIDTARSMPIMIMVYEPDVDTTQQIREIKPPVNTPVTLMETLPWVSLGVGIWLIGTLVGALVWMYVQHRKDPEIFSLKPIEPAHIVAFRDLDKLKEQKLWESGQVKYFYTMLTEITRHYIERQYGIPAMERTSDEILDAFRSSNTENSLLEEMLKELLQLADLVKFAKEDPLPVDNLTNLSNAYLFVQKTYPLFFVDKLDEEENESGEGEDNG
jgi:hypothetical protein